MTVTIPTYRQHGGLDADRLGSYRISASTGAVTLIAARTATAGQLLNIRRSSSATTLFSVKHVSAKFMLTTAYTAAQETGCDLIVARSFSASGTDGTAIDLGSTVANTGKLLAGFPTSILGATAGTTRVATAAAITAGTHTLDANPISVLSGWSTGVGDTVPDSASGASDGYGVLYDASRSGPLFLAANEGLIIRNLVLMGAAGVGRWDFIVEWDEAALR